MGLSPGTRLGPYEIVAPLGAGGMGEVYRARDSRLGRDVAIKVLGGRLAASPDVRARFDREAKAISRLNHPHICTLYDVGHESGTDYLVMELVEGETLAQRLGKGALPAAEVLRIGAQIADALDGAHSAGIVHRDLKPGNVMLTKGGAKLMDFGLARAIGIAPAVSDLTHSPTASHSLTAEGTILGTFQYMAPEQLEGKDAGAPVDLWALGCVLYEMTTGKRAFKGESQASLIGAIMNAEPAEMSQLAPLTPPALERVVKACLAKDPTDRLHSAHDVRLEIQWIAEAGSQAGVSTLIASRRRGRERIAWTLAAIGLVAAAASLFVSQRNRYNDDLMQMSIEPTVAARLTDYPSDVPVSPDGRSIAFGAADSTGRFLWVRPLDADEARRVTPVPGDPEENLSPFWSPDGREIAYFGGGKLKKVAVAGGIPVTLCDAKSGRGGSWNNDGVIVFSPEPEGPLFRVSAAGGEATAVTSLDSTRHETSHRFPHFLPDRDHFLFAALPPGPNGCDLFVGSLKSKGVKKIATAASAAIYAEPGYLVYERGGNVVAHRFDRGRVEVAGDAVAIVAAPAATDMTAEPVASASRNGRLVILESQRALARLVWVDRTGTPLDTIPLEPSHARPMRLSHDGRRAAVLDGTEMRVVDLERSIPMRFADTFTRQATMAWSPDDDRIAFVSAQSGREEIYVTDAGGVSEPEMRRTTETQFKTIYDWSPDGRYLVIGDLNASTSWDLWLLPMSGADKPERYIRGNQFEGNARISPDGRWLAYMSDESGAPEVYVQSFPKPGRKTRVSTDLGFDPSWSRGGQELLYASTDSLMSVAVEDGDDFRPGTPRPLFSVPAHTTGMVLTADGERALVSVASEETSNEMRIIFNWTKLLKR